MDTQGWPKNAFNKLPLFTWHVNSPTECNILTRSCIALWPCFFFNRPALLFQIVVVFGIEKIGSNVSVVRSQFSTTKINSSKQLHLQTVKIRALSNDPKYGFLHFFFNNFFFFILKVLKRNMLLSDWLNLNLTPFRRFPVWDWPSKSRENIFFIELIQK